MPGTEKELVPFYQHERELVPFLKELLQILVLRYRVFLFLYEDPITFRRLNNFDVFRESFGT